MYLYRCLYRCSSISVPILPRHPDLPDIDDDPGLLPPLEEGDVDVPSHSCIFLRLCVHICSIASSLRLLPPPPRVQDVACSLVTELLPLTMYKSCTLQMITCHGRTSLCAICNSASRSAKLVSPLVDLSLFCSYTCSCILTSSSLCCCLHHATVSPATSIMQMSLLQSQLYNLSIRTKERVYSSFTEIHRHTISLSIRDSRVRFSVPPPYYQVNSCETYALQEISLTYSRLPLL
jgi:hypothetical protein